VAIAGGWAPEELRAVTTVDGSALVERPADRAFSSREWRYAQHLSTGYLLAGDSFGQSPRKDRVDLLRAGWTRYGQPSWLRRHRSSRVAGSHFLPHPAAR
jgi:hypothetical protein